jgi:hypothetical protein
MRLMNSLVLTAAAALVPIATIGCGRKADAVTPDQLQQQYGISDAYAGDVATSDGAIRGTLVPVTLADGRKAQLFVPQQSRNEAHHVYLHDEQGLHPVRLKPNATRDQIASAPAVVRRRTARARSQTKTVLGERCPHHRGQRGRRDGYRSRCRREERRGHWSDRRRDRWTDLRFGYSKQGITGPGFGVIPSAPSLRACVSPSERSTPR